MIVQYNNQEIKSKEDYEKKVSELEIASLTARLATGKETGADRLKLETDLQNKIASEREKELKLAEDKKKKDAELAKEKAKLFEEESLAESTNAEKKLAAENKRYEAEKKMFEGHEDALEAIEKKHQRLMLQIQMEGQNDSFARMQTQHELERANLENTWKAKIAAVRAGSGEATSLQKQMAIGMAKSDLAYLEKLHEELDLIVNLNQ